LGSIGGSIGMADVERNDSGTSGTGRVTSGANATRRGRATNRQRKAHVEMLTPYG